MDDKPFRQFFIRKLKPDKTEIICRNLCSSRTKTSGFKVFVHSLCKIYFHNKNYRFYENRFEIEISF